MNNLCNTLTRDLAHPGGFVENVMNYINTTAVCEQPKFALAAALVLAGTLYGRHVQTASGQRTNLFVMTVGYTSSGKDHPLKMVARILDRAGASHLHLGQVTSDSAIECALKRQPRLCLLIDEAGYYFQGVCDTSGAGSAMKSVKPSLLELWSTADGHWKGKQRAAREGKDQPPVEIENPHLCLFGTTQPQIMFEALSRNDLRDGWLSRNLFFISEMRPKAEVKMLPPIPEAIAHEVGLWKLEPPVGPDGLPLLVTIPETDAARAVFADFNDEVYNAMLIGDKSQDETNYLYGKALENASRIALILAVSKGGVQAEIGREEAEFATRLVRSLIEEVREKVVETVAENDEEKYKKRILKLIAKAGTDGISRNELTRKTQYLKLKDRDSYLEDLLNAEEIVTKKIDKGGILYQLARLVPRRE